MRMAWEWEKGKRKPCEGSRNPFCRKRRERRR